MEYWVGGLTVALPHELSYIVRAMKDMTDTTSASNDTVSRLRQACGMPQAADDITARLQEEITHNQDQLNLVTEELQRLERSFTRISTHPSMNSYDQRTRIRAILDQERQASDQARHYNNVLCMLRRIAG